MSVLLAAAGSGSRLLLLGAFIVLVVLLQVWLNRRPPNRFLVRLGNAILLTDSMRARVGAASLARQPERISFTPGAPTPGPDAIEIDRRLREAGFDPAGSFTVPELQNLPVHLYAHLEQRALAAIYEHPRAGTSLDLVTRYEDGTDVTLATSKYVGALERPPGKQLLRAVGADAASAWKQFLAERPDKPMVAVEAAAVPRLAEEAYAEDIAWRRHHGVSAEEVKRVSRI